MHVSMNDINEHDLKYEVKYMRCVIYEYFELFSSNISNSIFECVMYIFS